MSLKIKVDTEVLHELDEQLHQSAKPVLESIAEIFAAGLRRKLAAGGFVPLSAATLAIRKRQGIAGTEPLHRTGQLAGSIKGRSTATVAAAGAAWPAAALQFGFTTGAASAIPGKVVPARPFVYLDESEIETAMDRIEQLYLGSELMPVPDFSDTLVADQGFAIIRALAADADVAAYFSEGILDAEETDGYIGTAAPPCLLVALDGMELKPEVGGVGTLTTVWKLTAVTPKRNAITTSGFLRARTFTRMARLSWGDEAGVLRDEAGNMLTEAVLTFQRFGVPRFGPDETVRADMFLLFDATVEMETLRFVT